jgi:class 3 adenylate cyclase
MGSAEYSGQLREYHYLWEWDLRSSPAALWPLAADTNRFNRDTAVPAVEERGAGANARRRLRFSKFGIGVEWEEEPFEWIEPHRFSVVRRYVSGPVDEMRVVVDLERSETAGTRLRYQVWARPRNLLGRVAIPVQIGVLSRRRFEAAFRRYDELAAEGSTQATEESRARLVPGARGRLRAARERLAAAGVSAELADRLVRLVERGDELAVSRIRPYRLADDWGFKRRSVLEACLQATRASLLELQWDLLCPLCRGAKETASTLDQVGSQVHCETCNIDFQVNFDRSVELTFRPNAAIREVERRDFCVAGPRVTPHVAIQQLLSPGERRSLELDLEPGSYRLRTFESRGELQLEAAGGGLGEAGAALGESGWPRDELRVAPTAVLALENGTGREQLVVLERVAWREQAATAAEVTALQLFRDLFSSEILRPGEPIAVGTLTVVFTDLRDSTRFYREVGDAPAFGSVMDHLDALGRGVAEEEGAVVKSMGDAIMAVFVRPVGAVRALLRVQQELASPPPGKRLLLLKGGIHTGPCIAITQNDRLDYFGSTVNVAARLVGLSSGTDLVVSDAVLEDPEVAAELAGGRLSAEPFDATLKGLEEDSFELFRLTETASVRVRA